MLPCSHPMLSFTCVFSSTTLGGVQRPRSPRALLEARPLRGPDGQEEREETRDLGPFIENAHLARSVEGECVRERMCIVVIRCSIAKCTDSSDFAVLSSFFMCAHTYNISFTNTTILYDVLAATARTAAVKPLAIAWRRGVRWTRAKQAPWASKGLCIS